MPRLATLLLVAAVVASCGGKSGSSSSSSNTTPAGGGGAKLPWEAAFTVGATFTLVDGALAGMPEGDDEPLTIKVTNVEDTGSERVYTLSWSDGGNGLEKIIVRDGKVTFNDVKLEDMQEPYETPIGMCYGEDLSNPDGCDDICDGQICMDASGIQTVGGLYAPGLGEWVSK